MLPFVLFIVALFVAPQLWVEPIKGLSVDLVIYPLWILTVAIQGRFREIYRLRSQDWMFVGMLVWIFIGMQIKGAPSLGPEIMTNYVKWFLLYRLICTSIDTPQRLKFAGWVLLLVASFVSFEAISHLNDPDGLGWAGQSLGWVDESAKTAGVTKRTRWVGIFDGPGVFCVMFTVALPFALRFLDKARAMPLRLLFAFTFVPLLSYAIFSTGSRGGILTGVTIAAFWVLSRYRISLSKLVMLCVLAACGMMFGPAYLTSTRDANNSAQNRVDMWVEGIEMLQYNPVMGIGKGNFLGYTGKLIAHNSTIEAMGETGLVGLFLWFGILYCGFKNLVRRAAETTDRGEREMLIALGLSLIGYMVSSIFVTLEYETFYILLGMAAAVRNWADVPVDYTRRDVKISCTILGGLVLMFKLFAMLY